MSQSINIIADIQSSFSFAAQQNAYPLINSLRLEYTAGIAQDCNSLINQNERIKPLTNIRVVLSAIDGWLEQEEWLVDNLAEGQELSLPKRDLKLPFERLFGLTEELTLELRLTVLGNDDVELAAYKKNVSILPVDYWGGESRQPDLLAAFVKPNGVYVESLIKQVSEYLEQVGYGRSLDGYQSNTREKPYMMLAALWNIIFNQKLAYVSPPRSFAENGQRIRLASDISQSQIAACLDSSVLFASCIEAMGLNPVVALSKGHAFAGAWLIDERLPVLTNDDPMDIRKRVDNRDMVFFETTLVTNTTPVTFEQAKAHARELISEEHEHDFVYVIDIAQARARQIKPLSTVEDKRDEISAGEASELSMPVIPPLPPVRAEERVQDETPETRVDAWSRKLLDLTKRNSLLNFKDRAVSIRIFCPDIAAMEDMLAGGEKFKFLSAEESPLNDQERDAESFKLKTGSDIHKQYALDQLASKVLIANQGNQHLEKSSVALFRKMKNDLEEGGSNTLFLALGMLRWKENPDDDRSYRAPLILIPVTLSRKSARAPVYLQQLDEDPIFNLTLLEFLQTEHDIDLSEFKGSLPKDESGIDVPYIWNRVREAISEQRGFEVVEEMVLASFSFAKYLMWKDLRDRIDILKENPFVKHLVDNPRGEYPQRTQFIDREKVDDDIDPANVFTPLNCDSSQLVAVEASGRKQDFVLEGPPGTGKSETIANIIAHNIGLGRKVLFVAEKMAALNVVYRRMQKIGLDHLCLELHSNKTNKKAVLEQLSKAWQQRQGLQHDDWQAHINELKQKKEQLNDYVRALHKKHNSGLSLRDTLSKLALCGTDLKFSLGWNNDLNSAPVQSQEDLTRLTDQVDDLTIAYKDISGVDLTALQSIRATSWSNAWQSGLLDNLARLSEQLTELNMLSSDFLQHFDIEVVEASFHDMDKVYSLGKMLDSAVRQPMSYALKKGAKERLKDLSELANQKAALDEGISDVGHGLTAEILELMPLEQWLELSLEVEGRWFKGILHKWKINAAAKKLGLSKFDDLEILNQIQRVRNTQCKINELTGKLIDFNCWHGWGTDSRTLQQQYEAGNELRVHLSEVIGLVDDPVQLMIPLNKWLIDGREFLVDSKLSVAWERFKESLDRVKDLLGELNDVGFYIDRSQSLVGLAASVCNTIEQSPKYKSWCEWLSAKELADKSQLATLAQAIEAGEIGTDEASEQFFIAYCQWLAPLLIDNDKILRTFKSSTHEQTIARFRELDEKVAEITSEYIVALASKKVPSQEVKGAAKELGVLAREIQKKTRHIPARTLIGQLGESLLDLCPCLMMSPLSVAQFLPPDFKGFDLVVFDEASQMTTWDSVGAIARGKNVIVVGDPKQMPPTNFFSGGIVSDDPDEEDLESILDQALAARLPLRRLMGHYRSRHETLIAFSNSKYYENSLVTYPSSDTKESAVSLHRVNGAYAKGKGRNNPIEAKAVVKEVVKRLKSPFSNNKTMGIVTLNSDQQRLIEDLLDNARRADPELEHFFHTSDDYDAVFVKNLESVQGDERDIIILSLGYGPTEVDGKTMSMNFGPLNKSGGERRLNVAITRATSEVLVFSSFDSSMVDLSRTSSTAVEHLKHYLEFAERGPRALAEQYTAKYGVDQFDSDFEQAVAFALRDKGWIVQTQVGVSKFRVDMGILHPDKPGTFLAGVECDGATYHGSPAARDRDRVRQAILENLGWRILRLWSTDYFIDPVSSIEKLDALLKETLEQDRKEAIELKNSELTADIVEVPSTQMKSSDQSEELAVTGVEGS